MTADHISTESTPQGVKELDWPRAIWRWLIEPPASVPEKDRAQARLLSYLLLFLILFLLVAFPALLFFDQRFRDWPEFSMLGAITGLLCLSYGLSRTRHYRIAALLTVLVTAISIWVFIIAFRLNPTFITVGPVFVIVSVILSSLLLSDRFTTLLSALHLGGISLLPVVFPGLMGSAQWVNLLIFVGIVSALTVLGTAVRQQNQKEIERQSEALSRSEERLRLVSYATNDVVWDWNLVTNQMERSQSIRRLFGYAPDQVKSEFEWWEGQIHPEDREKITNSIRAAIDDGETFWSKEYRFRRADGSYAHVFDRGYLIPNENGIPVRMLGAMMDITRWRQVEEELATERNLLRTLIDILPDDVYAKDTQSRFILVNPAVAQFMGVKTTSELLGKTDFDFCPPELAEQYFADEQHLFQTGQPIIDQEEPIIDRSTGEKHWNLTAKIPLRDSQGKIVGLVGVGRDITARKLNEEALQDANQKQTVWIDELERRKYEITLLNEMTDLLQTCTTVEEAGTIIARQAASLFPTDAGALYVINTLRNDLELAASWGPALADPPRFDPDDCWGLWLVQIHLVDGATKDTGHLLCRHIRPPTPPSYVCIPLLAHDGIQGLLHLRCLPDNESARSSEPNQEWFSEAKQQLVRNVAQSVSLSLVNLKLRETLRQQSIRDSLSGMFNRRYMEESLEREIHRATRAKQPLGIIMLDIDHFKQFNDNFGHEAGDAVLRELGLFLRSNVRGEDIACRYGGEEFVLIMPNASLKITKKRAEKLREGVKHLTVEFNNQVLDSLTISLGLAMLPEQGSTGEIILRAADGALYEAKQTGRDRVVIAK